MRIEARMAGNPGDREIVAQALVSQVRDLMYAMAQVGDMYVAVTIDANIHMPRRPTQQNGAQQHPPGELF